jgi:iron(III) transport system ATP-binding protein
MIGPDALVAAQPSPAPPRMNAVIAVRGLTRAFGRIVAVDGVDLDVLRGRTLALLGPSGCGKTTMLRLIAGFERPDAGTVDVDGRRVAGARTWVPPERRRVGMVFQDYALFPHLSVGDNIAYGLPGRRGRTERARVATVLELVGLAGLQGRYPHELSGGQQQRVALARALAPEPSVILLDEPFSNLDATLRVQVRTDVHGILHNAGASAVFVTHDQEEALAIADEVVVMTAGRIAQRATPEGLYHAPADRQVAAFVGDADFLPGDCEGDIVRTELGTLRLVVPLSGSADVLVRPEDVRLERDPGGDAMVVSREFFGHDQLLSVRIPTGRTLRARLGPITDLHPGDRCRVSLPTPVRAYPLQDGTGPA